MQEFNINIEIGEDGNIKADTKGMKGEVCVDELKNILKGLEGEQTYKNKPEFYSKNRVIEKNKLHIIK
jgi:hypothetical protein